MRTAFKKKPLHRKQEEKEPRRIRRDLPVLLVRPKTLRNVSAIRPSRRYRRQGNESSDRTASVRGVLYMHPCIGNGPGPCFRPRSFVPWTRPWFIPRNNKTGPMPKVITRRASSYPREEASSSRGASLAHIHDVAAISLASLVRRVILCDDRT
jgi:hypothetical protein